MRKIMKIEKVELTSAAAKVGISNHQAEELWTTLHGKAAQDVSKLNLPRVLYYFGALIVIIAMGWFIGITWEHFGGGGILCVTVTYIMLFLITGNILWRKKVFKIPGGLFITVAICLIPLAIYGFQKWTGWWITGDPGQYKDFMSWIRGGWFVMEATTILGGCLALKFYRFPFLTAPIFFSLWFMSMDVTPLIFKNCNFWELSMRVSIGFGILVLIASYLIDLKSRQDFAFWGYLFGMVTFWISFSQLNLSSEFENFLYCLTSIGLVLLSIFLQRSVFLIFGAIGIFNYITALFCRYFSNSALFPIFLSLIGILVVVIGMMYHKNHQKIDSFILNLLPRKIQNWIPKPKCKD